MRKSEFNRKYEPELGRYVIKHIYGEGIIDVFKSLGKKIYSVKQLKKYQKEQQQKPQRKQQQKQANLQGMKLEIKLFSCCLERKKPM